MKSHVSRGFTSWKRASRSRRRMTEDPRGLCQRDRGTYVADFSLLFSDCGIAPQPRVKRRVEAAEPCLSHSPIWFQLANVWLTTIPAHSVNSVQEQIRRSQNCPSWNQIADWIQRLDTLRRAALGPLAGAPEPPLTGP